MKLRQELTDYLKANTTGFKEIQEVVAEIEQEDNYRFDASKYPAIDVVEQNTEILQCLSGRTSFHQGLILITVSVLVNDGSKRSRNPNVKSRATQQTRLVDTKAAEVELLVDNLTFDTNGVYLQSSQFAGFEEAVIDGEGKKILQKILSFNCSYNA